YRELRHLVNKTACALVARGYQKGERIGLWSENSLFFVIAYLGTIRAGLVVVPVPKELTLPALSEISSQAELLALFAHRRRCSSALEDWAERSGVALLKEGQWPEQLPERELPMPTIDPVRDLAALMFTSGSTGTPKGVMVSHRNIESNSRDIVGYIGLNQRDRAMVVLPLHYCFGTSLLHTHLLAGGSVVLNNDFRLYPEAVLQEMRERECTGLAGVPSTYQILLRKSRFAHLSFPRLRWFQQAGGRLPSPCIAEMINAFPQVKFYIMYGQTEATARLSFLPPERLRDKLGSIGRGLPSTTLVVRKPGGTPVTPGSTDVGEILARGDNITLGYWRDPVETAKFYRDGWLSTGDLARVDADGFIFIVERERDIIKSGGNRVSAKEVEDTIAELREVLEVAVIGIPHEFLGDALQAFVVPHKAGSLSPREVQAYCRQRLPSFKVPERVGFLEVMPHNDAGKVLKLKLRDLAAGEKEGSSRLERI
ncbi:MAG: class I adenylate-forming enzyme family protein, partial [Bryobacteraceae bacterium]